MVRQVAERLASLICDENIQVICVLGGPFVGKTWLVNHVLDSMNNACIKVYDNVNSYDAFREIIANKKDNIEKYIIVGRLLQVGCEEIIGKETNTAYVSMYPMNYSEFNLAVPKAYNISAIDLLKMYMLVGGLPEVVKMFTQTGHIERVRERQRQIYEKIREELSIKGQKIINSVIEQELSNGSGFCIRGIDKNARDRDYGHIIDELINMGVIEKVERLLSEDGLDVRKYKLSFYDLGIYSMIMNVNANHLDKNYGQGDKSLFENFYYKELRTYIDKQTEAIKYWKKYRAKAKLSIIIEGKDSENRYTLVSLEDKIRTIPRSVQSFIKEYPMAKYINVQMPIRDKVLDGHELYNKIRHIT